MHTVFVVVCFSPAVPHSVAILQNTEDYKCKEQEKHLESGSKRPEATKEVYSLFCFFIDEIDVEFP